MYTAIRPFRYRGKSYKPGDPVPAEDWSNRRSFLATKRIRFIEDPEKPEVPPDPSKMKRADLNVYALSIGIANPEDYSNRELLLAAVTRVLNPAPLGPTKVEMTTLPPAESGGSADKSPLKDLDPDTGLGPAEFHESDDDNNPFADLEDEG
jgi:hypothetical protein